MKTITATSARSDFFKLLKNIAKGHLPTRISCKEGTVILISEDDYENLLETTELLSIPDFSKAIATADQEIEEGRVYHFDEILRAQ